MQYLLHIIYVYDFIFIHEIKYFAFIVLEKEGSHTAGSTNKN